MPLQQSALAPEFLTADMFGQSIRLSDFKGRPVMLSFMRYASCPLCNLRVREMVLAHERLANEGLVMLVVFQSSAESMREYVGRHDSPFALIPDPEMRLYGLYGVERSWAGLLSPANVLHAFRAFFRGLLPGRVDGPIDRMPADFLIGADGRIERAFYARAASEHVPLSEVMSWLHGGLASYGNGSVEGTA